MSIKYQHSHVVRARIILISAKNVSNEKIALELRIDRKTARRWRNRWAEVSEKLTKNESDISDKQLEQMINDILSDNPRPGTSVTFTPEQIVQIVAIACEDPDEASERPISHWTHSELRDEVIKRGVTKKISVRSVGRFLEEADLKPHIYRYWLNNDRESNPEQFDESVRTICDLYKKAPQRLRETKRGWCSYGIS